MTEAQFDPGQYVDLGRFPIHELQGAEGPKFLARCRAELAETGACNLDGFILAEAARRMAEEALALAPLAYVKDTRRNAYFTKDDPTLPTDHPLRAFFPLKMSQLANDAIPKTAAIQRLYEWDALTDFTRLAVGLDALYRIADPFLALNLTYLKAGDLQPWHYDHNEFTVTLLLQNSESGGAFEYAPRLRTAEDENFDAVKRLFAGAYGDVRTLPRRPGTLTIFKGRHAMHRVTEVRGQRQRISALLSYDSLPDQVASDETNAFIYGPRVAAILAAKRA
ncbi:MAG TPA: hypothetical protein VN821_10005 [Candidatus Udaeobacter sp.]|nr:hypothetical protein [Candidatus Udaeobacter sp.]